MHVRQDAYDNESMRNYYTQSSENFMYYNPKECSFVLHFNSTLKSGVPFICFIRRDEQRELFDYMDGWIHKGRPTLLDRFRSLVCNAI